MNDVIEKMEHALNEIVETKGPVPLRKPQSLADQVSQVERIAFQLEDRLRREAVEAQVTYGRQIADAHADYIRTLTEETARLGRQRDEMIRQAADELQAKLHELTGLLRRRS